MYKIILFSSLCFWLTACGNDQRAYLQEQRQIKELTSNHENAAITKKESYSDETKKFTKCVFKKIPRKIISYNNLNKFDLSSTVLAHIIMTEGLSFISPESFSEDYKELNFEQNNPCDQLKFSFSNELLFTTQIYNLINESEVTNIIENKSSNGKVKIDKSFMFISTSNAPDNISVLPHHRFRIDVDCESDLEFSCMNSSGPSEKCASISNLRGKFPGGTCKIKGSNQVFALYPTGQVRINFEGTLKKIGERSNESSELELVFDQVEWR